MKKILVPLSLLGGLLCSATGHAQNSAKFISQSLPVNMEAGVQYPVSVTVKNTGTTTWTEATLFRLNARYPTGKSEQGDTQWGTNRAFLKPGESVAPGQLKTFSFTVTAPNAYPAGTNNNKYREYDFQWGMVHDGDSEFGEPSPIVTVGVAKSPNLIASGIYAPKKPPVAVSAADFGSNFRGANILGHRYAAVLGTESCTHTEWVPDDNTAETLIKQAAAMGLNYLRLPVIIPPAVPGLSLARDVDRCPVGQKEWDWKTTDEKGRSNILNVTMRVQKVLEKAQNHGLKVLIIMDGYSKLKQADGQCFWKHSYEEIEGNARSLIQAISASPALLGWDVLNEPMSNAKGNGCLATDSDYASVVNAVHAMYNLIRDNDPYNHPTTVGEGVSQFYKYWRDISSFASPHLYPSARQKITENPAYTKTDVDQINYTQAAMLKQMEAAFPGVPLVVGEFGMQQYLLTNQNLSILDETTQANYYERFLDGMTVANHGHMLWALSTSPNQQDISILHTDPDDTARPAGNIVARQAWYPVIQQLYVGYLGRPADPAALHNFADGLISFAIPNNLSPTLAALEGIYTNNLQLRTMIDSLGNSAESRALYNYNDATALVNGIYGKAFKRAPAQTGLDYWVNLIQTGGLDKNRAVLSILAAASINTTAQGITDTMTIQKKGAVAANFTASLNTAEWVSCYVGPTSNAAGRTLIDPVSSTTDVKAYQPSIETTMFVLASGLRSAQPGQGKAPCQ